jgi:hypothetical protein
VLKWSAALDKKKRVVGRPKVIGDSFPLCSCFGANGNAAADADSSTDYCILLRFLRNGAEEQRAKLNSTFCLSSSRRLVFMFDVVASIDYQLMDHVRRKDADLIEHGEFVRVWLSQRGTQEIVHDESVDLAAYSSF